MLSLEYDFCKNYIYLEGAFIIFFENNYINYIMYRVSKFDKRLGRSHYNGYAL